MYEISMRYPRIKNAIKAQFYKILQDRPNGLLAHKDDNKIHSAETLGLFFNKPTNTDLFDGFITDQQPNNTCVFHSRGQGASHQNGIHLSIRWLVIVAYRNKWLSGDGFSSLNVGNKIANKIGYVPDYELPGNRQAFRSFKEYVTITDNEYNRLLEIAKDFRTPEYRRIYADNTAYKALKTGHVLFVGYKWTSNNNNPARYNYILPFTGYITGGHACEISGNKGDLKMNPQTFGERYGDKGVVWSRKFSDYGVYVEDMLPLESRLKAFIKQYDGFMVRTKGDNKCYVIQSGEKHHVKGDDGMVLFNKIFDKVGLKFVQEELLNKILTGSDFYPDPDWFIN